MRFDKELSVFTDVNGDCPGFPFSLAEVLLPFCALIGGAES